MDYTKARMVAEWKVRRGLEPLRTDATIEREDALDVDEYVAMEVAAWYDRLLETAPLNLLETEDITDKVEMKLHSGGVVEMQLPEGCRRLVELRLEGWECPATIVAPDSRRARLQKMAFARSGNADPTAVLEAGGVVRLYRWTGSGEPNASRVLAVMTPPAGIYRMKEQALNLLNTIL